MSYNVIDLKRSNTFRSIFQWRDSQGDPIDLTGASAIFSMLNPKTNIVSITVTTESGHITHNATGGDVTVVVQSDLTTSLPIVKHEADLKLIWPAPETTSTATFFVNVIKNIA